MFPILPAQICEYADPNRPQRPPRPRYTSPGTPSTVHDNDDAARRRRRDARRAVPAARPVNMTSTSRINAAPNRFKNAMQGSREPRSICPVSFVAIQTENISLISTNFIAFSGTNTSYIARPASVPLPIDAYLGRDMPMDTQDHSPPVLGVFEHSRRGRLGGGSMASAHMCAPSRVPLHPRTPASHVS